MKKRIWILVSVSLLCLIIAGCSLGRDSGSSSALSASSASSPSSVTDATLRPPAEPEKEYQRGKVDDDGFFSDYWSLRFTPPEEGIVLLSQEQLKSLIDFGSKMLSTDDQFMQVVSMYSEMCEMVAVDMTSGTSLLVISQELPLRGIEPQALLKGVLEGVRSAASGIELEQEGEMEEVALAGHTFTKVAYTVTSDELPTTHQEQYALLDGKYALIVTVGYSPEIEGGKEQAAALLAALEYDNGSSSESSSQP